MLNKIKNIKLSKSKYIYTVIAGLIIIAIGFTFAWWRWSSEINALVNGQVCAPEIVFVGGTTINGHDLLPVRTKEEGLIKDINVNLNNACDNDTAVLNLNLKPDVLPEGLSDPSFKWALYEVTTEEVQGTPTETLTYVNDGNFNGKRQYVNDNDLISIATDLIVTENISTYRLFIWIDGTMDNPSSIGDNFFKFSIYGTGKDAIYREYVMNNNIITGTNTSYFLVEALPKTDIESINITDFNGLPEGEATISLNGENDRSILVTYTDTDEDGLYEVYIGTSNGTLTLNTKMDYMFAGLTNVSTLDLSRLDTSNVTSMVGVFYNSPSLTNINMNNWDTSNVTNMNSMFQGTSGLTSLDVSNFNTSKVTTMANMFNGCKASSIDVSNFSNDKVTSMQSMFQNCQNLTNINLSNFKTPVVSNMLDMFSNCSKLKEIDVSSFNTSNVSNMGGMFYGCSSLRSLDLSNFNTSSVTKFSYTSGREGMFEGCSSLISLDLSNFNTSKAQYMYGMFKNCRNLESLDISDFDIGNVTAMGYMFQNCSKLESLDLSSFTTFKATSMEYMFNGCTKLESVNLSNLVATQVTSLNSIFRGCTSLKKVDFINFETPNLTSVAWMFADCSNLEEVDLSNLNPTNLTSICTVFYDCSKLKQVNFTGFDFSKITATTGPYTDFRNVPNSLEVIVDDCGQVGYFKEQWTQFTNVHTPNNDNCTV